MFHARIVDVPARLTRREPTEDDQVVIQLSASILADCRVGGIAPGLNAHRRGDIDVIPKGIYGEWRDEGDVRLLVLNGNHNAEPRRLLPALSMRDAALGNAAAALAAELSSQAPDKLFVDGLALSIIGRIERMQGVNAGTAAALTTAARRRLEDYISAELGEKLDLAGLASVAGLSTSSFTAAFRASFGTSAHRYILLRRLDRARALLLLSDRPIADIAYLCGFSSQSHMTRHFREILNLTPAQLRKAEARDPKQGLLRP